MDYTFYYADNSTLYLQVGLSSKKKAKKGLEDIAKIFCDKGKVAKGSVSERKDGKVRVLERYGITYNEENLILEKRQSQ